MTLVNFSPKRKPWSRRTTTRAEVGGGLGNKVLVKVGTFVKITSVANQVIDRVGFIPKVIIVWTTGAVADNTFRTQAGGDVRTSFGFASGAGEDQWAGGGWLDSSASASSGRRFSRAIIELIGTPSPTFPEVARAVLVSFNGDGFTIRWTANNAETQIFNYIALGGEGVQAAVKDTPVPNSGANTITGVGFTPNLVIHSSVAGGPPDAGTTSLALKIGAGDIQHGNQKAAAAIISPGIAHSATRVLRGDRVLVGVTAGGVPLTTDVEQTGTSPDGYSENVTFTSGPTSRGCLYLKVPSCFVANLTKATSSPWSTSLTGMDFRPKLAMLFGVQNVVNATPTSVAAAFGIGAFTDLDAAAAAFYTPNNPGAAAFNAITKAGKAYVKVNNNTPSIDDEATGVFLPDGFSLQWTAGFGDTVATEFIALLIGDASPPPAAGTGAMPTPTIVASTPSLSGWFLAKKGSGGWGQSLVNNDDQGVSLICPTVGDESTVYQSFQVGYANRMIRIAGRYSSPSTNRSPTEIWLEVFNSLIPSQFIGRDGKSIQSGSARLLLTPTFGTQRDFVFDILVPAGITDLTIRFGCSGGHAGDSLSVYECNAFPIYMFAQYEPRLAESSVGDTEQGASPFVGDQTLGVGNVQIIIADGAYNVALPQLLILNKRARLVSGGTFADGQEILRNNCRVRFYGYIKDFDADDDILDLKMEDARLFLKTKLPRNKYTFADFPDIFINKVGYGRPIVCGVADFFADSTGQSTPWIDPSRVGVDATTRYGLYEYADAAASPAGMFDNPEVRAYESQDAATFKANAGKIVSSSTVNLAIGWFQITDNIRPHSYNGDSKIGNHTLDFDIGAGALGRSGLLSWTANEVAAAETIAWSALDGSIIWAYSHSTHKFTVTHAPTFNLKPTTGAHAGSADDAWASLGYKPDTDKTGATSYTSDDPTFTDADKDHIILVRSNGFKDDSFGTYTGSPEGLIRLAPDIVRMLLQHYIRIPASQFDNASFAAARLGEGANPCFYFQQFVQTIEEILKRFEATMLADIVVDGDGTIRIVPYKNTVAPVRSFIDSDFITWKCGKRWSNIKPTIDLYYGYDPHRDRYASVQRTSPATFARLQIDDPLSIYTWFAYSGAAGSRADDFLKLYTANPDYIEFTAAGKLVDLRIGDKILISRSSAFVSGGLLSRAEFRVRYIRFNDTTGLGECHAVRSVAL